MLQAHDAIGGMEVDTLSANFHDISKHLYTLDMVAGVQPMGVSRGWSGGSTE